MTDEISPTVSGTCWFVSRQNFWTASIMLFGARKQSSLQSTIDGIVSLEAISHISGKGQNLRELFLNRLYHPQSHDILQIAEPVVVSALIVKFAFMLSMEQSASFLSIPISDHVPELM